MQRPWRRAAYCLASHGLLSMLSYITQIHHLRLDTSTIGLALQHQPLINKNALHASLQLDLFKIKFTHLFYILTTVSPPFSTSIPSPTFHSSPPPFHISSVSVQKETDLPWVSTKHGISRLSSSPCIKTGQDNLV